MSPYFKFKHGSALSKEGDKNQFACRPYKGVQRELGPADSGSLGTTNSSGFPITPCKSASSNISSPTITAVTSTAGIGINRDTGNVRETGHKGGSTRPKGFCFSDISGAQEGWRLHTGNKPEGSEQIYCGGALQDGGFPHGEGFNKTRGLVGQNRPEGCLLLGTSSPQSPEIPSISMVGHTVRVSVSAFRPILCPSHLHKTDETGGSPSEGEGNQTHCIPGRHIDHVQLSGHPDQPVEICQGPVSGAGPSHQREKISARSLPRNCAPGPGYFNYYNASVTSQREGGPDSAGGQAITGHVRSISPEVSNVGGQDNSCKAGNSSGSTVPSPPSSSDKQSGSISILHTGGETVLPPHGGIICGSQTGAGMVDARNARPQWGSIDDGYSRHGDRIRCFLPWLGCNLEGPRVKDGRTVVNQRTRDAHRLPGITGGITGNSDFCQREEEHQDISEDRQCIDQSIHKSLWGTHSWQMNHLATQIWKWCIERQIFLTAEHLPGVLNQEADEESRTIRDRRNWMLHPHLFSQIKEKMGPLEVDMFASRLTHQLPRYFSWRPDPAAEATDAFVQDWSPFRGYANPPWCLLLPTLTKIQREKAKVVLVAPI